MCVSAMAALIIANKNTGNRIFLRKWKKKSKYSCFAFTALHNKIIKKAKKRNNELVYKLLHCGLQQQANSINITTSSIK